MQTIAPENQTFCALMPFVFLPFISVVIIACSTPTPPTGADSPASIRFDGNRQDAGIDAGTGLGKPLPCSVGYMQQYMTWLPKYGSEARAPANPFTPVDIAGQQPYLVTAEGAQAFLAMNRASKMPMPAPIEKAK